MVTKRPRQRHGADAQFESCVDLDGDKTICPSSLSRDTFESCVVLDGDKTCEKLEHLFICLRVVLF